MEGTILERGKRSFVLAVGWRDPGEAGVREEGEKGSAAGARAAVSGRDESQPAWAGASKQPPMDSNLGKRCLSKPPDPDDWRNASLSCRRENSTVRINQWGFL